MLELHGGLVVGVPNWLPRWDRNAFFKRSASRRNSRIPHILTLIDSGEAEGFLYNVMPRTAGPERRAGPGEHWASREPSNPTPAPYTPYSTPFPDSPPPARPVGSAVGLALAIPMAIVLSRVFQDVDANDPVLFGAVTLGLVTMSIAANYAAARKAAQVDPVVALAAD